MGLVGGLLGAAVVLLLIRLVPLRASPLVQLGQLDARHRGLLATQRTDGAGLSAPSGWARLGRLLSTELTARGLPYLTLRQNLALTGRDLDEVMGRKVLAGVAGLLLSLLAMTLLQVTLGLPVPLGAPLPLALGTAAGLFFLPDLEVARQASVRREDFRRALGAYLDLVALEMAGSASAEAALVSAAKVGAGWPMALLRDTLYRASRSGRDQWTALTELGERIGVAELRDLGALVRLVKHDGARVRLTLSARAATMRRRELADAEGKAAERDVSMRLAQLVVGAGFLVFMTYPAVVNVLSF